MSSSSDPMTDTLSPAVALLDMDGTVANFDGIMTEAMERLRSPGEPAWVPGDKAPDWMEARSRLIATQPGFWRNLPKLQAGFDIAHALEALNFEVHVLTKGPSRKSIAWTEKKDWCDEHLPSAFVTITEAKRLVYGKVLVDDWPPYFTEWLHHRPRGVVIVPAQSWNVMAEDIAPANIFRYDTSREDAHIQLFRVLRAVRARAPGQNIDVREAKATLRGGV